MQQQQHSLQLAVLETKTLSKLILLKVTQRPSYVCALLPCRSILNLTAAEPSRLWPDALTKKGWTMYSGIYIALNQGESTCYKL